MQKSFSWKLFFTVWGLATLGAVAIIPYQLALLPAELDQAPLPLLLVVSVGQSILLIGALTAIGLFLARRTSLGLPFIESWIEGNPRWDQFPAALRLAIPSGVLVGVAIVALEIVIFQPALSGLVPNMPDIPQPSVWKGFLASFYGGVTEEVMLRLFFMTLLVWLGNWISRRNSRPPTLTVLWLANVVAALLFGLGHLPATAAVGIPLNGLVVTRSLVLNGAGGIVFGWLYWRKGLESAIAAHFCTDIVLHVLFPLIAG
ncbi:MAG: CPBP family intramembrane metalloprotease [Leptolyngbyaceae cyanobacterium MO_188.B28]|nr:CPBP family intramembrane metalloprotease [Leptolyngbyaceae cyanobacterium MO_188.B28]